MAPSKNLCKDYPAVPREVACEACCINDNRLAPLRKKHYTCIPPVTAEWHFSLPFSHPVHSAIDIHLSSVTCCGYPTHSSDLILNPVLYNPD